MVLEWKRLTLGDLGRVVTGKTPKTSVSEYFHGDIPFVTPSDMDGRKSIGVTRRCLSLLGASSVCKELIPTGSVLVSCIGSDMGKTVVAGKDCFTNQQINSLIVDSDFSAEFVYYSLSSRRRELRQYAAGGSAQPILNKGDFSKLPIDIPPLSTQEAIAHILGTLDDKIELNRRMNETLEGMARALFKSWFVDFDPVRAKMEGRKPAGMDDATAALFPESFQDSELGEIPAGWEVTKIESLSGLNQRSWSGRAHPESLTYLDLASVKSGRILSATTHTWEKAPSRARRILSPGDTIVGTVRPGNRSYAYISSKYAGYTGSTGFAVLSPRETHHSIFVYLAATSDQSIDRLAHLADGAAYPAVRPEVVSSIEVINPGPEVLVEFQERSHALFELVAGNESESFTLAQLRDTLLPKLLAGELEVSKIEKHIEEVI